MMDIIRVKDQGWVTLEEDFTELYQQGSYRQAGAKAMLSLLNKLHDFQDERKVFGLTSRFGQLAFLAEDRYESPWFVRVAAGSEQFFAVVYRMPSTISPWPDASVGGSAQSVDEAVQMVLTAMDRSEGWKDEE